MSYTIKNKGLVIKINGAEALGSDFNVEIKELDEKNRTFWAIANAETPDRQNDIVSLNGWDLKNYRKNPVGLFAHNYFEHPHFKTTKTKMDQQKKQFLFKPEFDTHDKADVTWNQFKNGFMNSFSVGFLPKDFTYRNEDDRWDGGKHFNKQELLEISAVPVPAHPDANIMRSLGLDTVTLSKMGYKSGFEFDEQRGLFWFPTAEMDAYKEPRMFQLKPGIKAVNAVPLFEDNVTSHPAIGYYFDSTMYSKEKAVAWLKENGPKITTRHFNFDINEDGSFKCKGLEIMEKEIGLKGNEDQEVHDRDNEGKKIDEDEEVEGKGKPNPNSDNERPILRDEDQEVHDRDNEGKDADGDDDSIEIVSDSVGEGDVEEDNIDETDTNKKKPKSCDSEEDNKSLISFEGKIFAIEIDKSLAEKPYPSEHACRLVAPKGFDKYARKNCAEKKDGKCIDVIYGIKNNKSVIQALRFKVKDWTEEDAKKECGLRGGSFVAASGKKIDNEESNQVKELKALIEKQNIFLEKMAEVLNKNLSNSTDEIEIIELDELSFSPVSRSDDSITIEIDSEEEFKELFSGTFKESFGEEIKKQFQSIINNEEK